MLEGRRGEFPPVVRFEVEQPLYRSAIGSLMYLAVCTRPDIATAVSGLSRFNRNPGMAHWEGVQHVLRYLQGTSGEGLCYKKGVYNAPQIFVISTFLGDEFCCVQRVCVGV